MDDYYELLGVEVDAPVDDIRTAYRDKRAAVSDSGTEAAKADAAALNKAWNVLSDPYQRGRYDQQRADAGDDDGSDDDDDEEAAAPARRPAKAKANTRANARANARTPLQPTVKLPPGVGFPTTRQRIVAMFIDIGMLVVLFIGSQLLVVSLEKSHHAKVYHQVVTVLPDKINKAHDTTSAAKKSASTADNQLSVLKIKKADATTLSAAQKSLDEANAAVTAAKAAEKKLNTDLTNQEKVLAPTSRLIGGLFFVASLILLFGSSLVLGGRTIGKRAQGIRVVRLDGAPARAADLFRRYALLIVAAYALFTFLGPVGALIVVFVSTMWTRNPNQQGLQDRFAKTLVVTDTET